MKALVIGATGLLGRHAAAALDAAGHQVTGTSTSGSGVDLACDIRRPESVVEVLRRSEPELVLLAAGQSSVRAAWGTPSETMVVNTGGPFNVLESIRCHAPDSHLIFASSATVYGAPATSSDLPFEEASPPRPASPYGASKSAAELFCVQYGRQCGLGVTIARIFNLIGPAQSEEQAPAEFARAIAAAEASGRRRAVLGLGNPEAERDFLDVRDAAKALADLAAARAGGIFNVCSGEPVRLTGIAAGLAAHSRVEVTIERRSDRAHPADVPVIFGSSRKLKETTGWQPEVTLDRSLAGLLDDWRRRLAT